MKISRIYRLLRLITMLQSKRNYTVDELADELEVSRRTVFRDLNVLEMAHIPYQFDPLAGGYSISQHFFLPPVNLTITEALAMLSLTGRLRTTSHVPLAAEAARAAVKLESVLPREIGQYVGTVLDRLSMQMTPTAGHERHEDIFNSLTQAVGDRHVCKVGYGSLYEGKDITTLLRPLRLVFIERAWYVIAYSELHKEIRTFKVVRIKSLSVLKRRFVQPEDVDLTEYFGDAWKMIPEGQMYDVHLHFAPRVARNVAEVRWHRSQTVHLNADGSSEFHVAVDGLGEITWWLLGYGDQVTVVSPPALAKRVADIAKAVVAKYDAVVPALPPGGKAGTRRQKKKPASKPTKGKN